MAEKFFRIRKGLAVNTASPAVTLHVAANDGVFIPVGNTAERPSGANGIFRYNSDDNAFEGYANGAWGAIGGAGGGSAYYKGNAGTIGDAADKANLMRLNSNNQSANITKIGRAHV